MQKMRTSGDRPGRPTRRRSAVWLVPNPTAEAATHLASEEPRIVGALALDGSAAPGAAPACVVIVEDAPHTARLLRRALESTATPVVTLIDASQLGADGAEAYRRARAASQSSPTHVLFITATTALELSARGVDGGVLLRAPFEIEQVIALIHELIDGR